MSTDCQAPEIDYGRVDELVSNCQKLYPDMDKYVLWVLACDYYLKEELKYTPEEKDDDEHKDIYEKCKEAYKTREYNLVKVEDISTNIIE